MKKHVIAAVAAACLFAVAFPAGAVNLDNATPIQGVVACVYAAASHSCTGNIQSPFGKSVVIEFVSMSCDVLGTSPRITRLQVATYANGYVSHYPLVPAPVATSGTKTSYGGGQAVSLYSDPNHAIGFSAGFANETSIQSCLFTFSGQQY